MENLTRSRCPIAKRLAIHKKGRRQKQEGLKLLYESTTSLPERYA